MSIGTGQLLAGRQQHGSRPGLLPPRWKRTHAHLAFFDGDLHGASCGVAHQRVPTTVTLVLPASTSKGFHIFAPRTRPVPAAISPRGAGGTG
jgi:hypothetical protein